MLRVVLKFELSLSLAFLFAGCTGWGRAVSPGPQRPASAPRQSTPPPIPGVHGAEPHVARQRAVLEDAPRDGVKNQVSQSCADCGCGVGRRGRPVYGRMPGDRQEVVVPRGRDC